MGSDDDGHCIENDDKPKDKMQTETVVAANDDKQVQDEKNHRDKTTTTTATLGAATEASSHQEQQSQPATVTAEAGAGTGCNKCNGLGIKLEQIKAEKLDLEEQLSALKTRLEIVNNELEREVHRRCDLEQRFTEEAKRSTDQIEELIAKSDQDDAELSELKKRFELYSRETSSMIENFTTNREVLTSQLIDLRQENDYLLGKFIGKSTELQNGEINLPQTVEELQFHCLTLNEKLILATLAREQLQEALMQNPNH